MIVNVNLMVQRVIPIKNGIMINDNVNVKSVVSVKRVIVGILVYALVRIVGIQKVLLRFQ